MDLLRDRVELKYRLSEAAAESFLQGLPAALPQRTSHITTVYLDRPDRRLLREARRNPRGCVKLRLREYADSPEVWVELKERRGDRSSKDRFPLDRAQVQDFLDGKLKDVDPVLRRIRALAPDVVVPVGSVSYRRTSVESGVRLTIDREIRYHVPGGAEVVEAGAVLELKRPDEHMPGWCLDALSGRMPEEYSKFGRISRLSEVPAV